MDKHNVLLCINSFKKSFVTPEIDFNALCALCYKGDMNNNYTRGTLWKLLLGTLPMNSNYESWIENTNKMRQSYKIKMKNYINLKKISGDPLGGSTTNEVTLYQVNLINRTDGILFLKIMNRKK